MKTALALFLAMALAACGSASRPPVPEGMTCSDENLDSINEVPDRANPDSDEYDHAFALGWYLAHGCTGGILPSMP